MELRRARVKRREGSREPERWGFVCQFVCIDGEV